MRQTHESVLAWLTSSLRQFLALTQVRPGLSHFKLRST